MTIYNTFHNIPGHDGYYLTEDNKIIGKKGNPLSLTNSGKGHMFANVFVNGKSKLLYLHRAIALVHVKGYFEGAVVDHIDRNPKNNSISNLRWVTQKQNCSNVTKVFRNKNKRYISRIRRYKTEILILKRKLSKSGD